MAEPLEVNWGCIGTGNIAHAMAQQLSRLPGARRDAICSASGKHVNAVEQQRRQFGYARALSLDELVSDDNIHVVYVASANSAHYEHCLAALRGGKHVLCEKPLTLTTLEAEHLFEEAAQRRLLLLDGTFSACLPACQVLREWLPKIGTVKHVELHKKIRMQIMQNSPIINSRAMGGGLFDGCGSYTMQALCLIFGTTAVAALKPEDVEVASVPGPNGEVDWDTTVKVRICGITALLTHCARDDALPSVVQGERGVLTFTLPRLEEIAVDGQTRSTSYAAMPPLCDLPSGGPGAPYGLHPGLGCEALQVQALLLDMAGTSTAGPGAPWLPVETMHAMSHAMDLVRHQIPTHLHYKVEASL